MVCDCAVGAFGRQVAQGAEACGPRHPCVLVGGGLIVMPCADASLTCVTLRRSPTTMLRKKNIFAYDEPPHHVMEEPRPEEPPIFFHV